jgi:hypothetical protein
MSNTIYKKLADFGTIHYNDKRIVVVTLQEASSDDKVRRYLSFHEHFWNAEEKKLYPRRKNTETLDKIISFTLPWKPDVAAELLKVAEKIMEYGNAPAQPVDGEDPF